MGGVVKPQIEMMERMNQPNLRFHYSSSVWGSSAPDELARGWNMAWLNTGPVAEQNEQIIALIAELQGKYVMAFRQAAGKQDIEAMRQTRAALDKFEVKLIEACRPIPIKFEISPVAGAGLR